MAQTAQLLTLLLLFLAALLIHYFLTIKEGFATTRTPLTKENVKALVDSYIQDCLQQYQKFKALNSSDPRVKIRLQYWAREINTMNDQYPATVYGIEKFDYSIFPGLTIEDLTLVKDFLSKTVGITYTSDITSPANVSDIDTLSSRFQSLFSFALQKAPLAGFPIDPSIQTGYQMILKNLQTLKTNIATMRSTDVPLFKGDIYSFAISFADNNFVPRPNSATLGTEIQVDNLPKTQTTTELVASAISLPGSTSSTTAVSTAPPASTYTSTSYVPSSSSSTRQDGMRFSELIQSLMTYTGMPKQPVAKEEVPLKDSTKNVEPSPTDMTKAGYAKDLKKMVSEEVDSRLKNFLLTPKDKQNNDIATREQGGFQQENSCYTSNALEQGSFFRGQGSSSQCPTITPEAAQPHPIDMSEYIRKDSIPCYGCTLK